MTSRRGAVKRKKKPQATINEEPPLVVNCICCHCEAVFQPKDVSGEYLRRQCPSCGRTLDEDAYDASCRILFDRIAQIKDGILPIESEEKKWASWVERFRWFIFKPIRSIFERRLTETRIQKSKLENKLANIRKRISAYAQSRYYTGEWFQRTRIPLKRTVVAPFEINVCYAKNSEWRISHTDRYTSGIVAEYRVFQELLRRVKDPSSILFGAQIVPNTYLPHKQRGNRIERLWSQIDCLFLTRQAAFVIEVKRRKTNILAVSPFEEIWATNSYEFVEACENGIAKELLDTANLKDESFALNQNSSHAVAFDVVCAEYDFDHIYEQVVYVATPSFLSNCREFVGNINVSCLKKSEFNFADIIENECKNLDEVISQSRLDQLGASFVETYGDLNQKRGQLHAQRIMNIQANSEV